MTNHKVPKAAKASTGEAVVQKSTKAAKEQPVGNPLPHQCLEVADICMRNSSAIIHADFQPLPFKDEPLDTTIHYMSGLIRVSIFEGENEEGKKETYYVYTARMGVRIVRAGVEAPKASSDEILMHIEADYDATYKLNDGCQRLQEDDAQTFGVTNAPFHVWPFFREHIASTMQKMGLRPAILPMYFSDPGKMGTNPVSK